MSLISSSDAAYVAGTGTSTCVVSLGSGRASYTALVLLYEAVAAATTTNIALARTQEGVCARREV